MRREFATPRVAEEELRKAEERFHHLVDAVTDYAIFLLDAEGRVATWNAGARRAKGYTEDEIIGQHFSVFYPAEDRAAGKPERILDTVRSEGHYDEEGWRVRKDGSQFWASVTITALRDETGKVTGFAKVTRDLTDRKRIEEALRSSEERFRLLVDGVEDYAIYMLDPEGNVTTWNKGAGRMTGYGAEEIVGRSFARFFPPEDVEAGKPARELATALRDGRNEDEGWRVRKDGSHFWANATLTALRGSHGEHLGFAKVTRDLTARREAEERERQLEREHAARAAAELGERKVRESEERYRALSERLEIVFENVADCILAEDREGHIVFANSAAASMFGYESMQTLLDSQPGELYAGIDLLDELGARVPADRRPSARVLAGQRTMSGTFEMRAKHGDLDRWVYVRAGSVLGSDGEPELAISIWHDVSLERLQERQEKYLAQATAALGTSLDRRETLANLAQSLVPGLADWCSIHVVEGDEARCMAVAHTDPRKGKLLESFYTKFPEQRSERSLKWRVIRSGESEVFNDIGEEVLSRITEEPERRAIAREVGIRSLLVAPIHHRTRVVGAICFVNAESNRVYDFSHAALAEELGRRAGVALENAELYADAQRAVRLAEHASRAQDEFLATVSHELRTPLSAILGWSQVLRDRVNDPTLKKPLEVIHRNALAQVRIIDDILEVSRIITGKFRIDPKPADLLAITRDAVEAVRPSANAKQIEILFHSTTDYRLLLADPDRLQQAIWNLLSNAVKFTSAGGKIEVRESQVGSNVVLSVTDTGAGIAPDVLSHVFDRFWQADSSTTRRVGGLGLGLALVRHIIELHGGAVEAASEGPGKGSTFTLRLPVEPVLQPKPDTEPPTMPEPQAAIAGMLTGLRILVVDDEEDARDLIGTVLREAGAVVETSHSAAEGLATFRRFRPDVLVSDIGMAGEDGFSLVRRVRALGASEGGNVPALALTAFARAEDDAQALAAGFTKHVGKPVKPDLLVATLREVARPHHA
ncbi:MAG TPA: PAS domain S-box protein [Polyangiaceae bacterium]|nr:PAS domain S-box protein [Polyangiaceae bacterium]